MTKSLIYISDLPNPGIIDIIKDSRCDGASGQGGLCVAFSDINNIAIAESYYLTKIGQFKKREEYYSDLFELWYNKCTN